MPNVVQSAVWTWYHTPWGVRSGDQTFITWHEPGQTWVGAYNEVTRSWVRFMLLQQGQTDDHNVAGVGVRPDGRLIAAYCTHQDTAMRVRISDNPLDVSAWGGEQLAAVATGSDIITYANLIYLSSESRWYLFFRYRPPGSGGIRYVTSADDGVTWSAMTQLITPSANGGDSRPYAKFGTNGVDRIDLSITDGHPNELATNSIYHMWYDAPATLWRTSAGVSLGALPFDPQDGTTVYNGATIKGWNWDCATAGSNPVMVYATFPNQATDPGIDHRYHYARWSGSAWVSNQIVSGGNRITTTTTEKYYSGGLGLDHVNTSIVYLSRQVGLAWELERWVTSDAGVSWGSLALTANSGTGIKNARPFVVRGDTRVIYFSGIYDHYTLFNTVLRAEPALATLDVPLPSLSSGALLRTLRGSHRMTVEARLLTTFQTGDDPTGDQLEILGGDVQMDATSETQRNASVTVDGRNRWPRADSNDFGPYGNELFIRRGVDLGSGVLWVPLGYYRIEATNQPDSPNGNMTLTCFDRMNGIREARLIQPRTYSATILVSTLFEDLVGEVYPEAVILFDDESGSESIGRELLVEEDRYAALAEVATGLGKVMFWDDLGILRITSLPDDNQLAWSVHAGFGGVQLNASRQITREGVYNAVVATGEGSDDIPAVRGVAVDANPNSPTRYGGRFGKVPRYYSSPFLTSKSQAEAAARSILRRSIGLPYGVDFQAVPNPALRPYDQVEIRLRDGTYERHVMERLTIPLDERTSMSGYTRQQMIVIMGMVA